MRSSAEHGSRMHSPLLPEGSLPVIGPEDAGLSEGCVGVCTHASDAVSQDWADTQELQDDGGSMPPAYVEEG